MNCRDINGTCVDTVGDTVASLFQMRNCVIVTMGRKQIRIPGSVPLDASSDERAFLSHQQVLIHGWCLTWSTCLEKTCCLCTAASRGGGDGAGDAPLPAYGSAAADRRKPSRSAACRWCFEKAADQSGVFHLCRLGDTDKSVAVFFLGLFPSDEAQECSVWRCLQ